MFKRVDGPHSKLPWAACGPRGRWLDVLEALPRLERGTALPGPQLPWGRGDPMPPCGSYVTPAIAPNSDNRDFESSFFNPTEQGYMVFNAVMVVIHTPHLAPCHRSLLGCSKRLGLKLRGPAALDLNPDSAGLWPCDCTRAESSSHVLNVT